MIKPTLKHIQLYTDGTIYLRIEKRRLETPTQELVHNGIIFFMWECGFASKDNFSDLDIVYEESSDDYTFSEGVEYQVHLINTEDNIHFILESSPRLVEDVILAVQTSFTLSKNARRQLKELQEVLKTRHYESKR